MRRNPIYIAVAAASGFAAYFLIASADVHEPPEAGWGVIVLMLVSFFSFVCWVLPGKRAAAPTPTRRVSTKPTRAKRLPERELSMWEIYEREREEEGRQSDALAEARGDYPFFDGPDYDDSEEEDQGRSR